LGIRTAVSLIDYGWIAFATLHVFMSNIFFFILDAILYF